MTADLSEKSDACASSESSPEAASDTAARASSSVPPVSESGAKRPAGRSGWWVFIASVFLALLAQYYLTQKRDFMWDGVVLYVCAMLLFGVVMSQMERSAPGRGSRHPSLWQGIWRALQGSIIRAALLLVGAALVGVAATSANARVSSEVYYDLLAMWGIGLLLSVSAFVDWRSLPAHWGKVWQQLRRCGPEVAFVSLLVLTTILLRAINLENVPFLISGDEAAMGLEALDVLEGRRVNPFATGWLSHPTLFFFMQAASLRIFGISTAALRLPNALISGAIALLLYLYARRYLGRRIAVISLIFFACYHYAIHFGRIALNNIWDPFFGLAGLFFLRVGLEDKRQGHLLAGGLVTGLGIYGYMGARLVPIILAVYMLYCALTERDWLQENLTGIAIFGLMAFLASLPLFVFFRAHPQDMMARWKWIGIFPSGWVNAEVQRTGKTALGVLFGQFAKAALAFNYFKDPTFHYRPDTPLLRFLMSVFFVFGLTYTLRKIKERSYLVLLVWLLAVIVSGGALLENPPSSPRLVLAMPAVVMLVALGIVEVSDYVQQLLGAHRSLAVILSLALVLVGSYQSLRFYYGKYTPEHMYSDWNTEIAANMGKYLKALGPGYQCYYFGPPRIYYRDATTMWHARHILGMDVPMLDSDALAFVSPERDAVFVFLPERMSEFPVVRRRYPVGLLREFKNPKGQLMFSAYEVDL